MKFPRFKAPTIGLDVDRGAIKAVQLSQSREGYTLQHVGYHRLPEGVVIEGEVADSELLSRELREFWELHEFKGKSVIIGVSGNNVIVRFVASPRLSPEDLKSALGFQAEEHIPMPLEDVVLDHVVLGPSAENPDDDRVVLVAAHRDLISGYTEAVRSGGLKPVGVDVKALSLTRSTLPESLFDDEDTTLLLDIGTEFSNLVVVQGQSPTHAQLLGIGFGDFITSVAASADLPEDQTEKLILDRKVNISPFIGGLVEPETELQVTEPLYIPEFEDDEEPAEEVTEGEAAQDSEDQDDYSEDAPSEGAGTELERTTQEENPQENPEGLDPALAYDVRRGLEDAAARLASEVQRSIEFHNSRSAAREVSRVFISGEGALIAGLSDYLEDFMGLPTSLAKPAGRLVANNSNISDEQLAQMEPVLAVALGLAMEE
ncbi:MAG: type IV pilus assembly protein PilM [Rubrobacter sp.]